LTREDKIRQIAINWGLASTPALGPLTTTTTTGTFNIPVQAQEKENSMYSNACATVVNAGRTMEQDQRQYLSDRLFDVTQDKVIELRKKFGLYDERPETPEDIVERIKSDKFVIPERDNNVCFYNAWEQIQWRDPAIKRDAEGYRKALEALDKSKTPVRDAIRLKSIEEGLKAIQDFEAATL
jgi:hypothetical protein